MKREPTGRQSFRRKKEATPIEPDSEVDSSADDGAEGGPTLEPGQMAQLIVDMRNGVVDRQAAHAISGPLNDLAKAFAMQAEILRGVHDTQKDLQQAIKDDKKSEMVVNSTQALNETFRGVRGVQQKLLDELEERGKKSSRSRLLNAALALGFVLVVVGGFIWVRDRLDGEGAKVDEKMAGLIPGLEKRAERAEAERDALKDEVALLSKNLGIAREDLLNSKGDDRLTASELESLRREREAWEKEKARLEKAAEDLRGQVTFYLGRYEKADEEVTRLRDQVIARLAEGGVASLDPEEKEKAAIETPLISEEILAAAKADSKKFGVEKIVEEKTEEAQVIPVKTVIDDLNTLVSNHRGSQLYRVESIGSVEADMLKDVVFTESAPGQGVVKRVRAAELEISISGRGDLVEFNFKKGDVQQKRPQSGMGDWAPFYNDRYRMTVYCLNGQQWLGRNYGFFYVD